MLFLIGRDEFIVFADDCDCTLSWLCFMLDVERLKASRDDGIFVGIFERLLVLGAISGRLSQVLWVSMAVDVLVIERLCAMGDPFDILLRLAAGVSLGEETFDTVALLFDFGVMLPINVFDRRVAVTVLPDSLVVCLLSCRLRFSVIGDLSVFSYVQS